MGLWLWAVDVVVDNRCSCILYEIPFTLYNFFFISNMSEVPRALDPALSAGQVWRGRAADTKGRINDLDSGVDFPYVWDEI